MREGKFDVRENGEKSAYNYIFLFNDAVIFTKQKKKGYLYHLFLYLKRITVNPGTVEGKSKLFSIKLFPTNVHIFLLL